MEWNRIKVGSRISDVITKRLTIIRTKARGNIPGWKEIVTRDKGDIVTKSRKVQHSAGRRRL